AELLQRRAEPARAAPDFDDLKVGAPDPGQPVDQHLALVERDLREPLLARRGVPGVPERLLRVFGADQRRIAFRHSHNDFIISIRYAGARVFVLLARFAPSFAPWSIAERARKPAMRHANAAT